MKRKEPLVLGLSELLLSLFLVWFHIKIFFSLLLPGERIIDFIFIKWDNIELDRSYNQIYTGGLYGFVDKD